MSENQYTVAARKVMAKYDKDADQQLSKEEMRPFFFNEILARPKHNLDASCFDYWFIKVD